MVLYCIATDCTTILRLRLKKKKNHQPGSNKKPPHAHADHTHRLTEGCRISSQIPSLLLSTSPCDSRLLAVILAKNTQLSGSRAPATAPAAAPVPASSRRSPPQVSSSPSSSRDGPVPTRPLDSPLQEPLRCRGYRASAPRLDP